MSQSERNPRLLVLARACDPSEPADKNTFTPLNEARGSYLFAEIVLQDLSIANTEHGKRKWLFSGHIGCGKSSELIEVARAVSSQDIVGQRYLPIFLDIKPYLDLLYITPEAIQLAMVAEVLEVFGKLPGNKPNLEAGFFVSLFNAILDKFNASPESAELEAGAGVLKGKLKYIFKSPSGRDKVQGALKLRAGDLLRALNDFFLRATEALKKYSLENDVLPYDDFIIIVDTLDRIQKVPSAEIGAESHKRLFIEYAAQFTELKAFIIYTVPLTLARTESPLLESLYGTKPYVLPMVKVTTRKEEGIYKPGYTALREILKRRLGGQEPVELIDDTAFDYLVANTGGYIREFISTVGTAALNARGQTITDADAAAVIAENYSGYENGIKREWLPEMIALLEDPLRSVDLTDKHVLEMLESHYILEYRNGLSDVDKLKKNTIWYGLHPLVKESELLAWALSERSSRQPEVSNH